MAEISPTDASAALRLLADAALERETAVTAFADETTAAESDEEQDSPSPIFDSFYSSGRSNAIREMINFSPREFTALWNELSGHVTQSWNVGRGRRSHFCPKDVLFMVLTVFNHGGNWDFLGQMFKVKDPSFEKLAIGYMRVIWKVLYKLFVSANDEKYSMKKLVEEGKCFSNFKYARYATDVTIQESNRPTGSLQEAKEYFSGKHKLYGFKVEVSVLPNGLAVGCTKHYAGSVADIDVFYRNQDFQDRALTKFVDEMDIDGTGLLVDDYPNDWALLADKGYQGAGEICRVIHPKKKSAHRSLSMEDTRFNERVSSDRIIAENYFGRLCKLWDVLSHKYRWSERTYDMTFQICLSLTNSHVELNPLRADDHAFYDLMRTKLYSIGEETIRKRRRTQERYRQRRRLRMELQFREMNESDNETVPPN